MSSHILFSYAFDGKGGGRALSEAELPGLIESETLAWVHMDVEQDATRAWLESKLPYLDPFIVSALLADETRPRMTQIGDGILIILRGVNLNENSRPEDMVSVRIWIDPHRIISVRRRKLKAIKDIEQRLINGNGPKHAGQFICMLISRLFERMEPVLSELDDHLDDIEEQVIEHASSTLREDLVNIRKQAIIFRRYMTPQRDAIGQLRLANLSWLDESDKRHLQENYDHVMRYVEDLDAIRERAQIVKDELANMLSDRLNKNMYVLSVIAAIFLPLGFLTGLFGINLAGIPGAENPESFTIFSAILFTLVAAQIWLFKKLKWF